MLLVAMALVYMVVARPYVTMVQEELNAVAKMLSYLPEGMAVEQIVQDVLEIKDTGEHAGACGRLALSFPSPKGR